MDSEPEKIIVIRDLTRRFGSLTAVDALSLDIYRGEIYGLLGPNGAGKSTTIKMLNTLIQPDSGNVLISGFDLVRQARDIRPLIGVSPQELNLDKELTGYENLKLHGLLHRMPHPENRISELLRWAELASRAGHLVNTYSGGMQRCLLIARAIMHRPAILFLDEPTVGLDPQIRRRIWDMIRELSHEGVTILLTTHYIEEADHLCHRVGIMNSGRLVLEGRPHDLKAAMGEYVVEETRNGKTCYQMFDSREKAHEFSENLNGRVMIRKSGLEDVFIRMTGERITSP